MKKLITCAFVIAGGFAFAQQEYSFTNYFEATPFFNPAATGTAGNQNITALFRKQWVGFTGSPMSGGIVYDNILKDYDMGIGGYVFSDKIGETTMTNIAANYSYILQIDNQFNLAFGVDAGVDVFSTNYDELVYWDQNDRMFNDVQQTMVVPRAGAGIHFFTEDYYVGLSVPRLLTYNNDSPLGINAERFPSIVSNYYLTAGYNYEINRDFDIQANILGKLTPNVIPQGDINVMGTYQKMIGLGLGYKSLGFASILAQYTYDEVITIGYAFDLTLTKIANYSNGSHEIMIKYVIPSQTSRNMFK
jgi:type IX secretion system PorP/SprF family membrane protein